MYRKMEAEAAAVNENSMPHLECVDRVRKLPMVETALSQTAGMYERVKESSGVMHWTLTTAEATVNKALEQAAPIAAPLAKKLEQPIHAVDQTLCKGLSMVEEKVPLVKEPPQQIYETAKTYVNSALQPTIEKVSAVKDYSTEKAKSLKDLSLSKANEVLSTRCGNMALSGFDSTTSIAERYLDYYFPATEEEQKQEEAQSSDETDDKVLSTVYTVGRLSNKVARRLYRVLSTQIRNLNKENVQEYVTSLIAIMHLANHLNALKGGENSEQKSETPTKAESTEKTTTLQESKIL